jgi:hypothetical protein
VDATDVGRRVGLGRRGEREREREEEKEEEKQSQNEYPLCAV